MATNSEQPPSTEVFMEKFVELLKLDPEEATKVTRRLFEERLQQKKELTEKTTLLEISDKKVKTLSDTLEEEREKWTNRTSGLVAKVKDLKKQVQTFAKEGKKKKVTVEGFQAEKAKNREMKKELTAKRNEIAELNRKLARANKNLEKYPKLLVNLRKCVDRKKKLIEEKKAECRKKEDYRDRVRVYQAAEIRRTLKQHDFGNPPVDPCREEKAAYLKFKNNLFKS